MATARGLDAYGAIPVNELGAYDFVARYVALTPGKCVVPAEIAGYRAAQKSIVLVYEDNADDGLGGASTGMDKAKIANPILNAIKWPAERPVYFAFDMPGYQQDLQLFVACAIAFAQGINRPAAVYGDVDTCTYAHAHGVRYLWQFGEGQAPGVSIMQGQSFTSPWGQSVDPDTALVADYGQWAPTPPQPPAPPPKEEPPMLVLVQNPNNKGWAVLNLADGTFRGFANPDLLKYWEDNGIPRAKRQPTVAEWSHFTQGGTI